MNVDFENLNCEIGKKRYRNLTINPFVWIATVLSLLYGTFKSSFPSFCHFAWEYLGTTPKKNSNGTTINCGKWTLNLDQFKIRNIQELLMYVTFKNYFCHFSRNHLVGTPKNIRNRVIDCRNWTLNLVKFTNSNDFVTSVGNLYR